MNPSDAERRFREVARERGLRPVGRSALDKTLLGVSSFVSRSLFREEAARRGGPLGSVDPRARLLALLVYLFSVSLARTIPQLALHAALPLIALRLSRIRVGEFLGAGFGFAVVFSALMAAPASLNLFFDGTVVRPLLTLDREWRLGPLAAPKVVGFTREGLLTAATFLLRVLSSTAAAMWLTLSTRWVDLLRALRFLRVPPVFVQAAGMTVRYLHAFLRQAEEMHLGRKSRIVCRARAASERLWAGSRIAHSWERSLRLLEDVGEAMRARGFTGEAKFPPSPWLGAGEWAFLALVAVSCLGAHLA